MVTLYICFLILASSFVAGWIAVVLWHLAKALYGEVLEFVDQYHNERVKCHVDNDYLFTEWVQDFKSEPLNTMREYADAH